MTPGKDNGHVWHLIVKLSSDDNSQVSIIGHVKSDMCCGVAAVPGISPLKGDEWCEGSTLERTIIHSIGYPAKQINLIWLIFTSRCICRFGTQQLFGTHVITYVEALR